MMEIPPSITNLMNDDDSDDNILPKQQHSDVKIVKNSPATNVIEPQSSSVNVPNQFEQRPPPRLYLLYGIIILQTVIFISEIIIDQMVHSMLILADAYHHLFNSFNAILLVVCYKVIGHHHFCFLVNFTYKFLVVFTFFPLSFFRTDFQSNNR